MITLQSNILASIDIFQTLSWMFILTLPLIFLLNRGGSGKPNSSN